MNNDLIALHDILDKIYQEEGKVGVYRREELDGKVVLYHLYLQKEEYNAKDE